MRQMLFSCAVLGVGTLLAGSPVIDPGLVAIAQDPSSRTITVSYTLTGAPAIVMVDFQTNVLGTAEWASIGDRHARRLGGEVNKVVTRLDTPLALTWHPAREWPGYDIPAGGLRAVVKAWDLSAPPDYMVVDLLGTGSACRRFYPSAEALPEDLATSDAYRSDFLVMRRVPAKDVVWRMGSPSTEAGRAAHETTRYVKLTRDYYLAVFETTEDQVHSVLGNWDWGAGAVCGLPVCGRGVHSYGSIRGSSKLWPADGHDVDPASLIGRFRAVTGIASLDLPTEAQWEYACRAGTGTARFFGETAEGLGEYAWNRDNSGNHSNRVGLKRPNSWGFYDMYGNVLEWCLDYMGTPDQNGGAVLTDPVGAASGTARIKHGGCYTQGGEMTAFRSAYRDSDSPTWSAWMDGFRLCCDADVSTFGPAD